MVLSCVEVEERAKDSAKHEEVKHEEVGILAASVSLREDWPVQLQVCGG